MNVLVLRWPEQTAALMEKGFRKLKPIATIENVGDGLPSSLLDEADEMRVLVGAQVLFRVVTLEGGSGAELLEAAKFTAEPMLPLPLAELAVSAFELSKKGRGRTIAVAAISRKTLAEITAWAERVTRVSDAESISTPTTAGTSPSIPLTWIGPTLAALQPAGMEAITGHGWAGLAEKGRWKAIQSAREGREAAAEIERSSGSSTPLAWNPSDPAREYSAAAVARDSGTWQIGAMPVPRGRKILQGWPLGLAAAAALVISSSLAVRYEAARKRIVAADALIEESFAVALPGVRMTSPKEQLRSRLVESRALQEAMRDRIAKKGSALDILTAVERSAPTGMAVINDLRITQKGFTITGSATDITLVQSLAQAMTTLPSGDIMRVDEPEIRRTGAGLGLEFTLKGEGAADKR